MDDQSALLRTCITTKNFTPLNDIHTQLHQQLIPATLKNAIAIPNETTKNTAINIVLDLNQGNVWKKLADITIKAQKQNEIETMFLWTIALMENAEDIPEYAVQVSAKTWNAWENRNKERVRDFVEAQTIDIEEWLNMLLKMDDSAAELIAVIFEHIEEQDKFRTSLSEYYIRTFLEAKHIEPLCNPVGLYKLLDAETVDNLTPQIERAMLRNPDTKIEVSENLLAEVPVLPGGFYGRLFNSLCSLMPRSARLGAILSRRCPDEKVFAQLVALLGMKLGNPDVRAAYWSLLDVPHQSNTKTLLASVSKETNDKVIDIALQVICRSTLDQDIAVFLRNGFESKYRKYYLLAAYTAGFTDQSWQKPLTEICKSSGTIDSIWAHGLLKLIPDEWAWQSKIYSKFGDHEKRGYLKLFNEAIRCGHSYPEFAQIILWSQSPLENMWKYPELSQSLIRAIWTSLLRDSVTPFSLLSSLFVVDEDAALSQRIDRARDMMLIAHHKAYASQGSSPLDLILKPLQLEPINVFTMAYIEDLLDQASTEPVAIKVFSSIATRTPSTIPGILQILRDDLDPAKFRFTEEEVGVWYTPADEVYLDPLVKKAVGKEDAFDAEVRAAIAEKRKASNISRKLTKEESVLMKARMNVETQVRNRMSSIIQMLRRDLAIIEQIRLPSCLSDFIGFLKPLYNTSFEEVRKSVGDAYLNLGVLAQYKDAGHMQKIGQLALAIFANEDVTKQVQEVLFGYHFQCSTSGVEIGSFLWTLPLLRFAITSYSVDEAPELVSLALEVYTLVRPILFHRDFPMQDVLSDVLYVASNYPAMMEKIRDTLSILCGSPQFGSAGRAQMIAAVWKQDKAIRRLALDILDRVSNDRESGLRTFLLCCMFDEDVVVRSKSKGIWEQQEWAVEATYIQDLGPLLDNKVEWVRASSAAAIGQCVAIFPASTESTLQWLYKYYIEKTKPPPPELDNLGLPVKGAQRVDYWEARHAASNALGQCAAQMSDDQVLDFFRFALREPAALADKSEAVRNKLIETCHKILDLHGEDNLQALLQLFNDKSSTGSNDHLGESSVILFGVLAKFMNSDDERVPQILDNALKALETPSEAVQIAVSECIWPLMTYDVIRPSVAALVQKYLYECSNARKYGERRGAAFGLAGIIKGYGLGAIAEFKVLETLQQALEDNRSLQRREGALFAYEALAIMLQRLIEPFVADILPHLLICFGDPAKEVREATRDASKAIMQTISGFCMSTILPSLLAGLSDTKWRTKTGSIDMLGSMAYCAPKELAISLPIILPQLSAVLTDSHEKVRSSADNALTTLGRVIQNPEIQILVPTLLKALIDPTTKTSEALQALLKTTFKHYIDSPSLALVIPVISRGLRERSTDTKKKSARILGSMARLTTEKDIVPYMAQLLPEIREVLIDPVPEARASAAKALGHLVHSLGERNFPGLVNSFIEALSSDISGIDRQGSAQGLSEILKALGIEKLDSMLPIFLKNTSSRDSYTREGFMSLLIYIPGSFGESFRPYLAPMLPCVLNGFSDSSDIVREAALKAGQIVVANFANTAIDMLLPELESGLLNNSWRIRDSSIQLLGDLLYKICGIAAKNQVDMSDESEDLGMEASKSKLKEVLGEKRRNIVLAKLYVLLSDVNISVRHSCLHVWKSIVVNTPRTLKELLPVVMEVIISSLASDSDDQQEMAARSLADIVAKLGDRIMGDIIPILESRSKSEDQIIRKGVCIGLSETLATSGKNIERQYIVNLIPSIMRLLCDPDADVREAAGQVFEQMFECGGPVVVEEVVPGLLQEMHEHSTSEENRALHALKEIMNVKSHVVFPIIIPSLVKMPMSAFQATTLASLIRVAGTALNAKLAFLLSTLIRALSEKNHTDEDSVVSIRDTLAILVSAVNDEEGLAILDSLLHKMIQSESKIEAFEACRLLETFFTNTTLNLNDYASEWLSVLINLLDSSKAKHVDMLVSASRILTILVTKLPKDGMDPLVAPLRRTIKSLWTERRQSNNCGSLEGFEVEKGIAPLVTIFVQGLLYGGNDVKDYAAWGIHDTLQLASQTSVRPVVAQICGAMIRIAGDRISWQTKAGILCSLNLMLTKIPVALKPFFPQLQRTLQKIMTDPSEIVQFYALEGLGLLSSHEARLEPLLQEMSANAATSENRALMIAAIWIIMSKYPTAIAEPVFNSIESCITHTLNDANVKLRHLAALAAGALICRNPAKDKLLSNYVVKTTDPNNMLVTIHAILSIDPEGLGSLRKDITTRTEKATKDTSGPLRINGLKSLAILLLHFHECLEQMVALVVSTLNGTEESEIKSGALVILKQMDERQEGALDTLLPTLIPGILACAKERKRGLAATAERCLSQLLHITNKNDTPTLEGVDNFSKKTIIELMPKLAASRKEGHEIEEYREFGTLEVTNPYIQHWIMP